MFEFTLITPTSNRTITISWVECQTSQGSLIIQRGHAPLVAILKPLCEVRFENENGVIEAMEISGGIAEVRRDAVLIIVD